VTTNGNPNDLTISRRRTSTSAIVDGTSTGRMEIYIYGTKAPTPKGSAPPPGNGCLTNSVESQNGNGKGDGSVRYVGRTVDQGCGDDFDWNLSTGTPQGVYIYAPNSNVAISSNARLANSSVMGCTTTLWALSSSVGFGSVPLNQRPIGALGAIPGTFRECAQTATYDPAYKGCLG
jgi:hypothetical protein